MLKFLKIENSLKILNENSLKLMLCRKLKFAAAC